MIRTVWNLESFRIWSGRSFSPRTPKGAPLWMERSRSFSERRPGPWSLLFFFLPPPFSFFFILLLVAVFHDVIIQPWLPPRNIPLCWCQPTETPPALIHFGSFFFFYKINFSTKIPLILINDFDRGRTKFIFCPVKNLVDVLMELCRSNAEKWILFKKRYWKKKRRMKIQGVPLSKEIKS